MPKRKKTEEFAIVGEKDCWQLYGLQVLSPGKFVAVVGKILQGEYALTNAVGKTKPRNKFLEGYQL